MKTSVFILLIFILIPYRLFAYGVETPIVPFEIKGSGLSSPFFLSGLERFSYHSAQDTSDCQNREIKQKETYYQFIKKTNNRDEVDNFLDMFPYLKKDPKPKKSCEYTEVIWPSFEFSKTYTDLFRIKSDDEIAIHLINHIGDLHIFLSQFKIGYIHNKTAYGLEVQESVSVLIFNNIEDLGLESIQIKRQRILNSFYAMTYSFNKKIHLGMKIALSQVNIFEKTSAITDVSALKDFSKIKNLEQGFSPAIDLSITWKNHLGLTVKNITNRPYKKNLFFKKITNNQRTLNLSLSTPQYSLLGLSYQAAVDFSKLNNPYQEQFLNRLHMGVKISKKWLSWSTGLNQGNITNSLRGSFHNHEIAIGHIGYDHDEDLGFRQSERLFITSKSTL
ncbi:MAG: hypothetical protein AB8C84_07870 [Oligoflexales bacterium]